jgi:hypothetical protein
LKRGALRALGLACAFSSWAGLAQAAEAVDAAAAAPSEGAPPPRVELVLVGDQAGGGLLLERTMSWFRDPRVTTEATRGSSVDAAAVLAPGASAGVRIWIWLRSPSSARLFIAAHDTETGADRYWVSDDPLPSGLDELGSEQLAQLVHLSALAVWAGNLESRRSEVEAGLASEAAKPAPIAPPAQAAPREAETSRSLLRLGAGYSLRFAGDEGAPQVVSAMLGYGLHQPRRELSLQANVGVLIPRSVSSSAVELDLKGASAWLEAAGEFQQTERFWLTCAAGPGIDVVSYHASHSETLRAEPGGTDVRPFAQAALGARLDVGGVSVHIAALVLAQWLRVHYDVARDTGQSEVLVPWIVQPGAAVGVTW